MREFKWEFFMMLTHQAGLLSFYYNLQISIISYYTNSTPWTINHDLNSYMCEFNQSSQMEVVMLYIYPYKIIFTLPAGLEGDSILETNKRTDAQSCSHKSTILQCWFLNSTIACFLKKTLLKVAVNRALWQLQYLRPSWQLA